MMIEAEATDNAWNLIQAGGVKPDEAVIAQGIEASKPFIKQLVEAQQTVAATAAKPTADYPTFPPYQPDLKSVVEACTRGAQGRLPDRRQGRAPGRRRRPQGARQGARRGEGRGRGAPESANAEVSAAYKSVTKHVVRSRVLAEGVRIDGRGLADIRPLDAEVQVVPCVHGSAIFQRGETQILGVTTLNMLKLEQQIDSLSPVTKKRYMHNYNFPPYSTGETGRVGRRSVARSGTAHSPSARSCRCCPRATSSPTRSARSRRRSAPTARPRWPGLRVHALAPQRGRAAARSGRGHRDGPHLRHGRR